MKKILICLMLALSTTLAWAEAEWVTLEGGGRSGTWTPIDPNNSRMCEWSDGSYTLTPDIAKTGRCSRGWYTISGNRVYCFCISNLDGTLTIPSNLKVQKFRWIDLEGTANGKTVTVTSEGATFSPASVSLTSGSGERDYDFEVTGHQTGAPLHIVTTGGQMNGNCALLVEVDESTPLEMTKSTVADGATLDRTHCVMRISFNQDFTLKPDYVATLNGKPVKARQDENTVVAVLGGIDWNSQNTFSLAAGSAIARNGSTNDDIKINFKVGSQPLTAFPGAEGGGMYTTGGRGGAVYHVTTLEDSDNPTQGMLRWAINQSGPRTIVFDVAGTIYLTSGLSIWNGDLTIAGQTAPGQGICLADHSLSVSANNVIIRYIRVRVGDEMLTEGEADGTDAMGGRGYKNIIIDHCSCCWSTDECVSFYGNDDFTLQWCIISESCSNGGHSKGAHGYGGIWGGCYATFHHNYMVHHQSRTPRLGAFYGNDGVDVFDMRCNFIYNWSGNGCYGCEGMNGNIVGNFYKPGPATPTSSKRGRIIAVGTNGDTYTADNYDPKRPRVGTLYIDGNLVSSNQSNPTSPTNSYEKKATDDNWTYGVLNQLSGNFSAADKDTLRTNTEYPVDPVTMHSPIQVMKKVTAYAGCSRNRDNIDERLATEGLNGTTTFRGATINLPGLIDDQEDTRPEDADEDWTPWPILSGNPRSDSFDTDQDGMPDNWEDNYGLDAGDPSDRNEICHHTGYAGYTELEHYLASLVSAITKAQNEDALESIDAITIDSPTFSTSAYDLFGHKVNDSQTGFVIENGRIVKK